MVIELELLLTTVVLCIAILGWKFIEEYFHYKREELEKNSKIAEKAIKERK